MIKDDSQTKRTSFTERFEAMVGMKPREKEEVVPANKKSNIFGTVSMITTETNQDKEQVTQQLAGKQEKRATVSGVEKGTSIQ